MISLRRAAIPAALAAGIAAAPLAAATPAAAARPPVVVKLGEYFYRPATVTVVVGQQVVFVNVGRIPHTVADSTKGGEILSRHIKPHELKRGARQIVSFARPGRYYYVCTFHPTLMRGTITVR